MTRLMHNVITVYLEIKKNMPTNMGWVLSLQTKEEVDLTQDWGKKGVLKEMKLDGMVRCGENVSEKNFFFS